jgi:hypothetical protein
MITIRKNKPADIREMVSRSPVADVPDAEKILRECMLRSIEVRYGLLDGEIACMWGLIPPTLLSDKAYLWLLTTDIVAEHKFLFIRHSQRYIEEALKIYPVIVGDVVLGNVSAMRWLKWLGAEFSEPDGKRISFTIQVKNG